jgi:hypothetical protein
LGENPEAVGQLVLREIILPQHVDVGPGLRGVRSDGQRHFGPHGRFGGPQAHLQVEVVPADDGVLDWRNRLWPLAKRT